MPWSVAAPIIGAVAGSAISKGMGSSSSGGGAGSQTVDKSPWANATPWIVNNLNQGQALQNAYTSQPFSALQNEAYQNQGNQSAYMRAAIPSLLGQLSGTQLGYDKNNPNARPTPFNFNGLLSAAVDGSQAVPAQQSTISPPARGAGLLSMLSGAPSGALNLNANTPQVAAPAAAPASPFTQQQDAGFDIGPASAGSPFNTITGQHGNTTGSFGSFKYGDPMPQPGTQKYYDMNQYFAYGGADPMNMYGRSQAPMSNYDRLWAMQNGSEGDDGPGATAPAPGTGGAF